MFDITGKVALVTGGASGIGLCCAKELLRKSLKAVVLADISTQNKEIALQEIEEEFGPNRAAFIKTDVSNKEEFENAFKYTIETFKNIDILINNAGILNDAQWEKQISININGTVNGSLLGLEQYLPNYRSSEEAVVVNMGSIASLYQKPMFPVYTATKYAILGLTRCLGTEEHYQRKQVRFITMCPGGTNTPLLTDDCPKRTLGPFYEELVSAQAYNLPQQSAEAVAKAVVEVIPQGKNGSVWVKERNEPVYEIGLPPYESLKK